MCQFLIGALDMIEAGMKPSDAVVCGAEPHEIEGLPKILGVRSLRALNRMSFEDLAGLLQRYSISSIQSSRMSSSNTVG